MTLLMRDQENREIGREEGKVYGAVVVYRDLNFTEETIVKKIQEKFNLTEEVAKKYLL